MDNITRITLDAEKACLNVTFKSAKRYSYSLEYLRVCAPSAMKTLVCHKKQIKLIAIEPVGRHGYRFIFDDDFSDIFSTEYLHLLDQEYESRWQYYLDEMAKSSHNREASINFTAV